MLYDDFLHTIPSCPFCGENPHNRIIESREHAYLTYALAPYHKHHLLVLPRRHVLSIKDLTLEEETEIEELQRIGLTLLNKLGYTDITLLVREGAVGHGKSMEHIHFHIVPFIQIGSLNHYGEKRTILTDAEIEETMKDFERVRND